MSRLTTRIMAIMLFPLSIFLVGLLSIDQYRTTLIQSNSLLWNGKDSPLRVHWRWRRRHETRWWSVAVCQPTMTHLLPLVGLGSSLRARVFQPNGVLLADTAGVDRNAVSIFGAMR